jgi:fimbrial chaperone protein
MLCLGAPFLLGLSLLPAWGGTFAVSPVRIQVSTSRPNAVLQIMNRGDQPVTVQAHIVAWSFEGQKDVYADSDAVVLNPPIAVIAAHQSQLIRLGLRRPAEGTQERTYRLILEEVPAPPAPGFQGINTVLRLSIPIFAIPKTAISAKLNWRAVRTSDAHVRLIGANRGSAHLQIKSLEVAGTDSPENYLKGTPPAYLLPNQEREWLIQDDRARTATQIKVNAVTDAGVFHEIVDITPHDLTPQ